MCRHHPGSSALTAHALDSTNHNTSCRNNDLVEFVAAKRKGSLHDINFAAFVDEKTGVPVYYELLLGSLLDKSQTPFTIECRALRLPEALPGDGPRLLQQGGLRGIREHELRLHVPGEHDGA